MPDEAQQATEPDAQPAPPRRTALQTAQDAAQVAESALTVAQSVDESVTDLSVRVTDLDQRLRDRETAHGELRDDVMARLSGVQPGDAPTRDQVDGRITEAVQPLREEFGGYAGSINRKLDEMRQRLAAVEQELAAAGGDPVADTLAEDHISDQVEVHVRQKLDGILARLEAVERAAPAEGGTPGLTWDAIAERVDAQAKAALRAALASGHITGLPGLPGVGVPGRQPVGGVHAKVLQVMKDVGAIGKDRKMSEGRQNYTYRGIDDAMDAVGHAMREVGLVYTTEIINREVSRDEAQNREGRTLLWTSVMLTVRYTFIDPEDGSRQTFEMAGEGRASDDKATSKAAAMALKYGLLHALMIPVSGAIPDGDAEAPQVTRDAQQTSTPAHEPQQAPPEMSDQQRAARAVDAVRAIQALHVHPAEKRYDVLVAIRNQASREGLLGIKVDTGDGEIPVDAYARTALAMLQQQQAGQTSGAF